MRLKVENASDISSHIDHITLTSETLTFPKQVTIDVLGVSHHSPDEKTLDSIENLVRDTDFVVVENDITYLSQGSEVEASGFYDSIFRSAWRHHKKVICTDPADLTSNYFFADTVAMFTLMSFTGLLTMNLTPSLVKRQFSRRDFLKGAGILASLGLMRGTIGGEAMEAIHPGQDGVSPSPHLTDLWSYNEFRNTVSLLGLDLLIKQGEISVASRGRYFIGASHLNDYRGYSIDSQVDWDKVKTGYQQNLYTTLSRNQGIIPTARVWSPQTQAYQFQLTEHSIFLKH